MMINSVRASVNQQVKQDKYSTQATAKTKRQPEVAGASNNDDNVRMKLDPNQKLLIGAKSLMASLNKQLSLSDSISFAAYTNESVSLKDGQPVSLDKIEVEPFAFDFELVAKNVMDFVSGAILGAQASGASDEKLEQMLSQARSGVEQGFSMAREELKGFDIFTPQIEEGIDKSYELITHSFDDLEQQVFNPNTDSGAIASTSNNTMAGINLLEQEQGTISVSTRDGDTINIHFGNMTSLSQQQQNDYGVVSHQSEYNQSQSFSFQIEGTLDKQESKAVASLVKDISKLANNFFGGDIEKAWQQAGKLDFDDKQIAQFAFDFKELKQVAVEHYNKSSHQTDSPIATLAPYLKDLTSVAGQADSLLNGDNLRQLMNSVAGQQIDIMDGLVEGTEQNFVNFNERLINAFK